jgi:hypothetical protein
MRYDNNSSCRQLRKCDVDMDLYCQWDREGKYGEGRIQCNRFNTAYHSAVSCKPLSLCLLLSERQSECVKSTALFEYYHSFAEH